MNFISQFFSFLNTDSMTESQHKHKFILILFAEILIVAFMLTVTISDMITGNSQYNLYSIILLILYSLTLFFHIITHGKGFPNIMLCLIFGLNCLVSFYIKGNSGIGAIWLLVMPTLTMYVIGLSFGFYSTFIVFVAFLGLFIIPASRIDLLTRYSPSFLIRYTLFFLVDYFLCTVAMSDFQKLKIKAIKNQKELTAAVIEEHNKVVSMSMQTIISISNAVEAKDIHVGKHSQRVAHFACLIAKKMGWKNEDIERLHTIAMLHDIGKIGVESSILNKEGNLTDEEFEKLKTHTTIGGKILKNLTIIPGADEGANYHHEHFDGKGYPEGLSYKNIPLVARIICIADSFDAMKFPRIYKNGMSSEQIKDELINNRGTQFDPQLTDFFIEVCNENQWFDNYEVV